MCICRFSSPHSDVHIYLVVSATSVLLSQCSALFIAHHFSLRYMGNLRSRYIRMLSLSVFNFFGKSVVMCFKFWWDFFLPLGKPDHGKTYEKEDLFYSWTVQLGSWGEHEVVCSWLFIMGNALKYNKGSLEETIWSVDSHLQQSLSAIQYMLNSQEYCKLL